MPTHHEVRTLPYEADQMYALVANVENYPEFLPWTAAARIRSRRIFAIRPSEPGSGPAAPASSVVTWPGTDPRPLTVNTTNASYRCRSTGVVLSPRPARVRRPC